MCEKSFYSSYVTQCEIIPLQCEKLFVIFMFLISSCVTPMQCEKLFVILCSVCSERLHM